MGTLCLALREAALAEVEPQVTGRVVLLTGNATASQGMKEFFVQAGAAAVHRVVLPQVAGQLALRFAAVEELLSDPAESLIRTVDAVDPHSRGLVYAGSYTAVRSFCGRPILGARSQPHFASERKDVQRQLLDDASDRLPFGLENRSDIHHAIVTLAVHGPVVVQGVPHGLLAMGTSHTYVVPTTGSPDEIDRLLASIAHDCDELMVAPLDTGCPCTFYGFVTSDQVVDFGPFEALVYWDRRTWRLHAPGIVRPVYLGDREEVHRSAVHIAARRLYQRTGCIGAFGTDGVVSSKRYAIHEFNPRVCAGFALLDQMCEHPIPLAAVDLAIRERKLTDQHVLADQLAQLASALRVIQVPMIRLWNDEHRGAQDRLSAAAQHMSDPVAWLRLARRCLASEHFVPIAELDPTGANACG